MMPDIISIVIVAAVGAYIGALADRFTYWFHVSRAFVWHVRCPHCFSRDYWRTYVPIIAYVFRRGSCVACRERLPIVPLVLECIGAAVALALWWIHAVRAPSAPLDVALLIAAVIILWGTLIVAVSDCLYDEVPLIPYVLTLVAIIGSVFYSRDVTAALYTLGAGAVAGGIMLVLYMLSRGRWVHSHDVLIGVLVSFIVGWPYFLVTLAFAYLFAIIGGLLTWGYGVRQLKGASSYGMYLFVALAAQGILSLLSEVLQNYGGR